MTDSAGNPALRVAIIGLGPKGLFALERLLDHAAAMDPPGLLDVDVFEPHAVPGAGPVYDPRQPGFLRMNFAAQQVDMWGSANRAVPSAERLDFVSWRRERTDASTQENYPPRAMVGRYLADGLAALLRHAPASVSVSIQRASVTAVSADGEGWNVLVGETSRTYDEVMITTGHESEWDASLESAWNHAAPLIPAVFPVTEWLSPERVAPGSVVGVRGLALSFLDAALALTEGRGARFEALDHPYRLRHCPAPDEVDCLVAFSRTGRPMLAKPNPEMTASIPGLEEIGEAGRALIMSLPAALRIEADVVPVIAQTATRSLLAAGGARSSPAFSAGHEIDRLLRSFVSGRCDGSVRATSAMAELEHSLAVGAGLAAPDAQWALGHSWRELYPALVARCSGDGLADRDWPLFHRLAREMERLAFGPPAINAAKMLALIVAGRVDLAHAHAGTVVTQGGPTSVCSRRGGRAVDCVVDAVLPPPGVRALGDSLLDALLRDGDAWIAPDRRGLAVDNNCSCIRADGAISHGLSAFGRPTEDSVIGNDTISRALHPGIDGWGHRVTRRSAQPRYHRDIHTSLEREPA